MYFSGPFLCTFYLTNTHYSFELFAQISLDKLNPDLVIMDEFQRFKELITPQDTESGMLSQKFLHDSTVKVLLLSATPYKPYISYEGYIKNHFKPALGNIALQNITPRLVTLSISRIILPHCH